MTPSPSPPGSTPPTGARAGRGAAATLAPGVELIGERPDSGSEERRFLMRRGDGRMLEVSELVYSVAAAMRGHPHPEDVAISVAVAIGRHVTVENVSYLVEHKLRPLGVIADGASSVGAHGPRSFKLSVGMLPASVVGRIASLLAALFLPPVLISCIVALGAFDVWLLHHGIHAGLQAVAGRPDLMLTVLGLTIAGAAFHEFGHAAASRYGGADPGVIGVGMYLLWPVFYNDLNDSYRLGRPGRLRCDLGGVYFNAIFALALASAYTLTAWEFLLVAVLAQHLAMLQQFLPFIRLDGYYIVCDLAGTPDLYGYMRPVLRSLLSGGSSPELLALKRRSRRIVKAWVLVSIPMMVMCALLIASRIPWLVVRAWDSWAMPFHRAGGVWTEAGPGSVVLAVAQSVLHTVPVVGVSIVAYVLLRATVKRRRQIVPTTCVTAARETFRPDVFALGSQWEAHPQRVDLPRRLDAAEEEWLRVARSCYREEPRRE